LSKRTAENSSIFEEILIPSQKFELIAGVPDVFAAVDGSHVLLIRPECWTGLYNRKGVPSLNVQALVDAHTRIMSLSIRFGSCNDKQLWSDSQIGRSITSLLPWDKHLLGDAIYCLRKYMMTPFDAETKDPLERNYNYRHSRTRITVERCQ
jgi:hypothetical protein